MRLIREFMAAIERMIEKKEGTRRRQEIKKLYVQYFGDYALWRNASVADLMQSLAKYPIGERPYRVEMLAELFYNEAPLVSKPDGDMLLEKAYALYDYIDRTGKTYSLMRLKRMDEIKERLGAAGD